MRALRFHMANDLRFDDVLEPPAPVDRQVLVAPVLCGICGTDLHEFLHGPQRTPLAQDPLTGATNPQILGHEFSASVLEVGPEVETIAVGDRVSVMPLLSCGRCVACRRGESHHCEIRACVGLRHPWGGMSERALLEEDQLTRLPDGVTFAQGALVEPTAVSMSAAAAAGLAPGDTVLVCGAGPIGSAAAIATLSMGAGHVVVSEPNAARAAVLAELGCELIDPRQTPVGEYVRGLGGGADVALECSGIASALEDAIAAVRPGGCVVIAGLQNDARVPVDARSIMLRGVRLIGSVGFRATMWPRILSLMAAGRLPVDRMVGARLGLDAAIDQGFRRLADPTTATVKVLLECSPELGDG
jgi:(R,R)-butanediol dehydrogenase / meso-butanediol dehydrogenase / diacetyl reductase